MYISFIFLGAFWAGVRLLEQPRPGRDLKAQAEKYFSASRQIAKESFLYRRLKKLGNARKSENLQREMSESLSYIKNLVAVGRGRYMSTQLLLEELADISPGLGPVYLDMARSLQVYDRSSAEDALYKAIGVSYARDIGSFLAGWEDIPPEDLMNTVETYRAALREDRLTKQKRRDELISDLVYFPVVVNSMTVLLNFIYVAYFIQQKDALSILF
ncbi:MAG: hypothetical protein MJ186_03710 [Clostridia bacterium]|nr:hypothetical protein [Clostridia bacterium]